MLTKFETKSARVKGNGRVGLGMCWEPLGTWASRVGSCRPPLGSLSGEGRRASPRPLGSPGPLGSQVLGGVVVTSLCVSQGSAFTPSGRGSSPACTMVSYSCGIIGCAPSSTNSMNTTVSVWRGGVGTCYGGRLGCGRRKGGSAEVLLRLLPA